MATTAARMAELVGACSIELSPHDTAAGAGLRGLLPPGTVVFVNNPPSRTPDDIIAACMRLHRAGFVAVPHVVARRLGSYSAANDFVQGLTTAAGTQAVLLLGGDTPRPAGPFHDALSLLATGLLERHGIASVAFAGYPDGHPHIGPAKLQAALLAKLELARQRGLAPSLVTQFGFDTEPIQRWIAARRAEGVACPIRIGLAGPATVATLARYAVRCGIGPSLRALTQGHAAIARILTEAAPDALINALARGEDRSAPIDALHIFSFGGAQRTAAWREKFLARVGG